MALNQSSLRPGRHVFQQHQRRIGAFAAGRLYPHAQLARALDHRRRRVGEVLTHDDERHVAGPRVVPAS